MKSAELFRIINWLDEMKIKNYSINPDLTVDVDGDVDLSGKGLNEISVQFGIVIGYFSCRDNNLTTLEGAPREVGGSVICSRNNLTTLEGAPEIVGDGFYCYNNQLTSLEGAPEKVRGSFVCYRNQLTSLQGAPEIVGGWFNCMDNKKKFTEEEVKAVCRVGSGIYV